MFPKNEKILRSKRRRRGLFWGRAAVCLSLLFVLAAAAEGTKAVMKNFSASSQILPASSSFSISSRPASSRAGGVVISQVPAVSSEPHVSSSPENAPSSENESSVSGGKAPDGWFSDALFIGDSRTEGLRNYGGLEGATFYAVKGLMVNTVYTRREISENGSKETVMQAQAGHPFQKIYIMLGVNELGWSSMQIFVSDYAKMVKDLKKAHPGARVYLQANFPVSEKKSAESSIYKNKKIKSYNQAIQEIARKECVSYLDVTQAVSTDGVLPGDASTDGVHLNSEYCGKWCDYLKKHTD